MHRLKSIIEYDGTDFHGWQIQPGHPSIQGALTQAFERVQGSPVTIHAAGRTDAGVHALGQVIHCDVLKELPTERWQAALNAQLPPDIRVRSVSRCEPEFHARRSARQKVYAYRFWPGRVVSPFWSRYAVSVPTSINWEAMQTAAQSFIGTFEFTPFTVADCEVNSHIRTIFDISWRTLPDNVISLEFSGNGFLKYMVRRMTGLLIDVGTNRYPTSMVSAVLMGQRTAQITTAPAKGLTLVRVDY